MFNKKRIDALDSVIEKMLKSDIRFPMKEKVDKLVREGYSYEEAIAIVIETKK